MTDTLFRDASAAAPDATSAQVPRRIVALENALRRSARIRDAVVLQRRDLAGRTRTIAYVCRDDASTPASADAACVEPVLAGIDAWVDVSAIALNPDGDVDLDRLAAIPVVDADLQASIRDALREAVGQDACIDLALRRNIRSAGQGEPAAKPLPERSGAPAEGAVPLAVSGVLMAADEILPAGATDEALPPHLPAVLHSAAERHGASAIRIVDGEDLHSLSYAELLVCARRVAGGLRETGATPGAVALLMCHAHREFIVGFWGCMLAGVVPVPIASPLRFAEEDAGGAKLRNAIELLETPWLLVGNREASQIGSLPSSDRAALPVPLCVSALERSEPLCEVHAPDPDAPALMLLTSGSTGVPKAVVQTHRRLLHQVAISARVLELEPSDVSFNWFPLDHVGGIVMFHLRDLLVGCDQVHASTADITGSPLRWLDWLERLRATISWAPNFAFGLVVSALAQDASPVRRDLSAMRVFMNAGEAIVRSTAIAFVRALMPHGLRADAMRPAWGMSETCSAVTYAYLDPDDARTLPETPVSVGAPLPGLQIRIVDAEGHVLRDGEIGRLQIRGASVTDRYYRNDEANAIAFVGDGWFVTGDLGFLRDGSLTITGRNKDVIIVNGLNLHCHEIEAVIERVDGVSPSFVAAVPVRAGDSENIVVFVCSERGADEWSALIARVRSAMLRAYGIMPRYVLPVGKEAFSKTGIGKLQRQPMAERFAGGDFDGLIEATGQTARRRSEPDAQIHRRVWVRRNLAEPSGNGGAALVFADAEGLAAQALAGSEIRAWVEPGPGFARLDEHRYRIDPCSDADHSRLIRELVAEGPLPARILHAWSYGVRTTPVDGDAVVAARRLGFDAIVRLARALPADDATTSLGRTIVAVSSDVLREDATVVWERAHLRALVGTLAAERPGLAFRHIDFRHDAHAVNVGALAAEWRAEAVDAEVAYDGATRTVPRLTRIARDATSPMGVPLRKGGRYLIAGGLGGMAETIAMHLRDAWDAELLLIGRGRADAQDAAGTLRRARLQRIDADSGRVRYLALDLGDADALAKAVDGHEAQFGPIDGVFNLAGVYATAPLAPGNDPIAAEVLRAKVDGSLALDAAFAGRSQVFFVNMSSAVTLFRGMDNGAYAAANAFVEAFTAAQIGRRPAWCIAWSLWEDTGMSQRLGNLALLRRQGFRPLRRDEAMAALHRALARPPGHLYVGMDPDAVAVAVLLGDEARALDTVVATLPTHVASAVVRREWSDAFGTPLTIAIESAASTAPVRPDRAGTGDAGGQGDAFEPPTTPTEQGLGEIWCRVLRQERIGRRDNFFELGGSSLSAAELLVAIDRRFGKRYTFALVVTRPTIAELAAEIDGTTPDTGVASPYLVPLQAKGSLPPFFGAHPLFGLVYPYAELSRHLGPDLPFYALQARGYIPGQRAHVDLAEMARDYVAAIREVQPHGPYYLGGWSYGSLIALEMAQQLQDAGERIAALVIIDQATDSLERFFDEVPTRIKLQRFFTIVGNAMRGYDPYYVAHRGLLNAFRRPFKLLGFAARVFVPMVRVGMACTEIARRYVIRPYAGRIVLLHTGDPEFTRIADERLGWDTVARDGVEVHRIPGNHLNLHEPPHVVELAAKLRDALARCRLADASAPGP